MPRALYAGSFDPVTLGHVDIVQRAAALFEQLVVGVADNPAKRTWFDADERVRLFEASVEASNVRFVPIRGLLVHAAREHGCDVLVRGVRGAADLDLEMRYAQGNRDLAGFDTVFLPSHPSWSFVSSSLVKEIAMHGGDVARYLPSAALEAVRRHLEAASS